MFTTLLYISAGIGLFFLSVLVTAFGVFSLVSLYRSRMHDLATQAAKDAAELHKTEAINRLVTSIVDRVDTIADRLSQISTDAFLAEMEYRYETATTVQPATPESIAVATRDSLVNNSFIGDA